ncbi:hypothetical protein BKH46_02280 [Helicobacter sp. 12S02634-8]|uniref:arsenate reductase family protein n=1 Tax=Helicobacter sp. 12S02634-8 TaxID=1476199 RepID=UPI000BA56557|nr:ArsC/Spx/MgsR family protein [Helicobacter sp. 12S02634-8]PAF48155.1 hypothetical protein BKH46_02280 [Helicobacter sp. 12S02634-8]
MRLFGIKNCGSVQKARHFFDVRNIVYDFWDLKAHTPPLSDIERWVAILGIDVVLNAKGTTYKKLELKHMDLDQAAKIAYCHQYPLLLKRPIIDGFDGEKVIVGYDIQVYEKIFGGL